ncbi:hypothetical protein AVW11_24720 [Streptomyces amritsarensis]|uniref:Peptidase S11 D-alanyl-D-alanine carboxypeptidase A N-terminal domain-containing protein n=2 Tax=Streptomyces TaxID=1883 RepID=A0ABX3FZL1_9ACTN|nr:D-alanyl-D-alanine carboxypeptidase [Streptomyces amritsarensis]OLZ61226.1 hypothetical protein AVW11_24720 [Streptomyces amritsarensis]
MAGESPDKSVDEGTPGAAESSAEHDPRLSVLRPRESEDGAVARAGDKGAEAEVEVEVEAETGAGGEADRQDPLREAVAAWVATTAEEPEAAEAADSAASAKAAAPGSASASDSASDSDSDSASDPAPAPAGKAEPEPDSADSGRTAEFRGAKPRSADAEEPPAQADERPAASGPAAAAAAAASKPSAAAGEPVDSERTAVFRAVRPGSEGAGKSSEGRSAASREAGSGSGAAAAASKPSAAAGEPADSERTAVFRVPKVDALKPDGGQKSKPAAVKPGSASPSASGQAPASAPAPAEDSERTAVFRAPKPAAAPRPDAPKASTFVPLRTDGDVATEVKPKPPVRPTPPTPPAPSRPSAPASASTATERLDHSDRSERTTQQPLPPKPPLDMLADLTNNPPPPPSPLRTAVRRFKIYAPLVVLLGIILAIVQLVRPLPQPKLVMTAKSSYTFEGAMPQLPWPSEGQAYMAAAGLGTLGQSGEQKPVPIASVTKSMTAYIILRDHPIKKGEQGAMIDVDKTAETEGKKNDSVNNESTLDTVKEGDKISEYDAIAALMIPSANNIARLLARWDSGSQEAFVKKMNDTAKELGMTNTTYTDPSGLDATTVSTAEDQVKLGLKLVEIETLLDITKKPNWVDPSGKSWRNWNGLTGPSGALGIKTGTTTKAGGNLLFAAQKKIGNTNQLIVGAVLGQHKPSIIDTVLAASKQLMVGTQKALEGATVVKKGDVVGYVDDGLGGRTPVVATADVQAIGWASLTVTVKLADGGGAMPQTARAGTEVGVLTVGEGASQVKVPVALKSDLASPGIGSKLTRIG